MKNNRPSWELLQLADNTNEKRAVGTQSFEDIYTGYAAHISLHCETHIPALQQVFVSFKRTARKLLRPPGELLHHTTQVLKFYRTLFVLYTLLKVIKDCTMV